MEIGDMLDLRWKVLADLITDLKKRGVEIPDDVLTALRTTRSLINLYKTYRHNPDELTPQECKVAVHRAKSDLLDIESYLIVTAANKLGERYAEEWTRKLQATMV